MERPPLPNLEAGEHGGGTCIFREHLTLCYLQPRKQRQQLTGGKQYTPCNVTNGRSGLASCSLAAIWPFQVRYTVWATALLPHPSSTLSSRCATTVPPQIRSASGGYIKTVTNKRSRQHQLVCVYISFPSGGFKTTLISHLLPNVWFSIVAIVFEHLRTHVVGSACEGGSQIGCPHEDARNTKVTWARKNTYNKLQLTTNRWKTRQRWEERSLL